MEFMHEKMTPKATNTPKIEEFRRGMKRAYDDVLGLNGKSICLAFFSGQQVLQQSTESLLTLNSYRTESQALSKDPYHSRWSSR